MITFPEKILAVHDHLDQGAVVHAFGGAIALGFHIAAPRATADIDVNISADPAEAGNVLRALPPGVRWTATSVAQIKRDGQIRLAWDRTPVDLFFPQHELHEVVRGRVQLVPFGGEMIPVVSATDLTIFKAMFSRPKDWMDIEAMLAHGSVDRADARRWLVELMGADDARIGRLDQLP